jgi:hypothetical protein
MWITRMLSVFLLASAVSCSGAQPTPAGSIGSTAESPAFHDNFYIQPRKMNFNSPHSPLRIASLHTFDAFSTYVADCGRIANVHRRTRSKTLSTFAVTPTGKGRCSVEFTDQYRYRVLRITVGD